MQNSRKDQLTQATPSHKVMKENPRKSPRRPPKSATSEVLQKVKSCFDKWFLGCYQGQSSSSCSSVVALVREEKAIGKCSVWKLVGLFCESSLYSLYWHGRGQPVKELMIWNSSCLILWKLTSYSWYSSNLVHFLISWSLRVSHASLKQMLFINVNKFI